MDRTARKYLATKAVTRPVVWGTPPSDALRHVVVIPAYEESEFLPSTLASLAACPFPSRPAPAVLVVVNNPRPNAADTRQQRAVRDNRQTLEWLHHNAASLPMPVGWIDAASPGNELEGRAGVGLARRIGCDTALQLLAETGHRHGSSPDGSRCVLLNLDADTLVEPSYFHAAAELVESGYGAGAIPFEHQPAPSPAAQCAIDCYELYLHHYVLGLRLADSPYAFHSVGSTMSCTAEAYVKAGGMPRKRLAGEDFYFMQNLARTAGVCELTATVVHPSARPSGRVPFGTGPRVAAYLDGREPEFNVFDPAVFRVLKSARAAVCRALADGLPVGEALDAGSTPAASDFLRGSGLVDICAGFRNQFSTGEQRIRAFDTWFDGLATFRLIRHLSETETPPVPILRGWRDLLAALDLELPSDTPAGLLRAWRDYRQSRRIPRSVPSP